MNPGVLLPERPRASAGDPAEWTWWWELHRHAFLRPRIASLGRAGGAAQRGPLLLQDAVGPLLERVALETRDRELVLACLVALARSGETERLPGLLARFMAGKDQEISEAAILAHGIAGLGAALPELLDLFLDTPRGRELVGDTQGVRFRKRAFAGYALGLIAGNSGSFGVKLSVCEAAREVLDRPAHFEVLVAAIQALRLLDPDPFRAEDAGLTLEAGRALFRLLQARGNHDCLRAHAATALASLIGRARGPRAAKPTGAAAELELARAQMCEYFKHALRDRSERFVVGYSFILGLGQVAHPDDSSVLALLWQTAAGVHCGDLQSRNFAHMALGRLGGSQARSLLLGRLRGPAHAEERPWIALALGVLAAQDRAGGDGQDQVVGRALSNEFICSDDSSARAGIAIALGLAGHQDAGPWILDRLRKCNDPALLGHYAVALGLLEFRVAAADLGLLLERSRRAPLLFREVALALALMDDPLLRSNLAATLVGGAKGSLAQASLASALGLVGDHRALGPLVELLLDPACSTGRTFAAEALGRLCAGRGLPSLAAIGFGLNYRAAVETLTGSSGVLIYL